MNRKRLTVLREERGWSKAELARRAGLHPSQVGQFEGGRLVPYPVQLAKLAGVLDWPQTDVMRLMEDM